MMSRVLLSLSFFSKKILRLVFRGVFSFFGGLVLLAFLIVLLAWIFIYIPTIGESKRIDAIAAEFKAHGCRSIHSYSVPMFADHGLLKHLKLEKKVLERLVFGPGAVVPQSFLNRPPYLPDLEMVSFSNSDPGDKEFRWALSHPSLRLLNVIEEHQISLRGFLALGDRREPITLVLERVPSVTRDLQHLALLNPPALYGLTLSDCILDGNCFGNLARLKTVQILTFERCTGYSSEDIDQLDAMPDIKAIHGLPAEKQAEMDEHIRKRIESTP